MHVSDGVPTLAERFRAAGFATGAFVAAFPLDRRFGLARGFDTYSDTMPRDAAGRQLNERPARAVVDEAIAWLNQPNPSNPSNPSNRLFLWVHLFEPHAPYGDPANPAMAGLSASDRYDREVGEADAQVARLLAALGERRARTLVIATSDHGEAFGEHGEFGHSMFVYDTTLRVPLVMSGPGIAAGQVVESNAGLVDVASTIAARAGLGGFDGDGRDLLAGPQPAGAAGPYYAESFAPLFDFGWSPLTALRLGDLKYIEAPRAELYDMRQDSGEQSNRLGALTADAARLEGRLQAMRGAEPGAGGAPDRDGRLAALGYVARSPSDRGRATGARPDPKDKIAIAAAIARITSGEAQGAALETALVAVLAEDPGNPQMHLRLGFVLAESGRCPSARRHFDAAIRARMPTADAHLGLASCQAAAREFDAALRTLRDADRIEPGNPVVAANLGLMLSESGKPADAIAPLERALAADPDLHQARFGLALALARLDRRDDAAAAARELLRRLTANAPQRPEVERFVRAVSTHR
jgi:arylsulfatase A-like enzyme/Tfp pilus assembly protein PilF